MFTMVQAGLSSLEELLLLHLQAQQAALPPQVHHQAQAQHHQAQAQQAAQAVHRQPVQHYFKYANN